MNNKERFMALMEGEKVDRVPIYYFGTWRETKERWQREGLEGEIDFVADAGPQVPGMDPDWEYGMWGCHGLVRVGLLGDIEPCVIEETDDYIIRMNEVGEVTKEARTGTSMPLVLKYALEPAWDSWNDFKRYLDPEDPRRRPVDWEKKAEELMEKDMVLSFMGGSLYGWFRNWMGIENISYLMYDDPDLYDDMMSHIVDMQIKLMEPVLKKVKFQFAYLFEDCCGSEGPLFSPEIYTDMLDRHYRKLISFYKDNGVDYILLDSDGKVDKFVPLWLDSGVDIIFPLEVGKWKANPADMRSRFGDELKIIGGVDKSIVAENEDVIRKTLLDLKPEVDKGGFLPMPDHRIPPHCSLEQFKTYIRVFREVFSY